MHDLNFIAPTPPAADNSNQIATTAFVQAALAASNLTVGTSVITGGTTNGLLYDNAGVLGNLATANSGVLITSGAGAPSIATTLPSGLTLPAPIVTTSLTYGGVTLANSVTGTGSMVLATSPTLVTPSLGVATATTITGGSGSTADGIFVTSRAVTLADRTHDFRGTSTYTYNTNGSTGQGIFSDESIVTGTANTIGHAASFQNFMQYTGSGVLSSIFTVNSSPTLAGTGTVTNCWHFQVQDIAVSGGGSVGTQYGLLIPSLTGATTNRGILVQSPTTCEFRGPMLLSGTIAGLTGGVTLANGLNSNIAIPSASGMRVDITGPTGAFSVGGFASPLDGQRLHLYNTTSQTMTIVNEDASSTAANRIKTLTGANIVLRTNATSFCTLSYDGDVSLRWIVESTN